MPFAEVAGAIAQRLEHAGERNFLLGKHALIGVGDAVAEVVASGQTRASRR